MRHWTASNKLWFSRSNSLAAMALGCGLWVAISSATTGTALAQTAAGTSQAARTDAQIQTDVQAKLASAPGVAGQSIEASASNGVVTLSGSVADEVTRQLAENAASEVAGVKSVQNHLTVGGAAAPSDTQAQASPEPPQQSQPQPAPSPASEGGWGPAGPPPDAQNGQIPPQPAAEAQTQGTPPASGTSYGPPAGPAYPQTIPGPGYPQPGYPPANGQLPPRPVYRSNQPVRRWVPPSGPVTVPAGTLLTVRLQNYIDAHHLQPGEMFVVNAARDVFEDGVLAIPLGATLEGHVVSVKKPGAFSGGGDIQIELSQLDLDGHSYPIATDIFSTEIPGKGRNSAANTIGGTAFGALLGAAIGGGSGAAVGAVAGGVGGAALSTATPGPRGFIPAETMITFHLKSPVTFQPVSPDEATRLAASMPRPQLRPRPVYYGPPPGYYGYPYYR